MRPIVVLGEHLNLGIGVVRSFPRGGGESVP
jgi:hypothetical protein